jgi:3D (Asp-Asp-Asp) domain-containing protein
LKIRVPQLALRIDSLAKARRLVMGAGIAGAVALVVSTAIMAKEARTAPALMQVVGVESSTSAAMPVAQDEELETLLSEPAPAEASPAAIVADTVTSDSSIRWFNGRPAKPYRVMTMTVTAYSPDARSCGEFADGKTATLHSVETNGGHLVAADTSLLPYGSMLSIEGYDGGQIVPVLDCGGAIKGRHIDLLFPTHEQAREWGVKKLKVTVWRYVDGKPAGDPRKMR